MSYIRKCKQYYTNLQGDCQALFLFLSKKSPRLVFAAAIVRF